MEMCQPIHRDGRAHLVVRLQHLWGEFSRELIVKSAMGGCRTRTGRILSRVAGVQKVSDIPAITSKRLAGPGSNWEDPKFAITQARMLRVENYVEINLGLASANVSEIKCVRNFIVHPNSFTGDIYARMPDSVDYILTSPPYFNAIDYPRAHKFSQWWLWPDRQPLDNTYYLGLMPGGKNDDEVIACHSIIPEYWEEIDALLEVSPAIHKRLCKYVVELDAVVVQFERLLKKGGKATFVVGDNVIRGHGVRTSKILATMLGRNGLTDIQIEPRTIRAERRRYPYGIAGFKGPMETEYVIHAIRP